MSLPALTFECYQMESGVWCKRRDNGLRGACVADEAILWQHLQAAQAALGQKPPPSVNIEELVRENERLSKECERIAAACASSHETQEEMAAEVERLCQQVEGLNDENRALYHQMDKLKEENAALRANQRKKPGRKPRSDAAGAEDQALAASEQQDPLDEDL